MTEVGRQKSKFPTSAILYASSNKRISQANHPATFKIYSLSTVPKSFITCSFPETASIRNVVFNTKSLRFDMFRTSSTLLKYKYDPSKFSSVFLIHVVSRMSSSLTIKYLAVKQPQSVHCARCYIGVLTFRLKHISGNFVKVRWLLFNRRCVISDFGENNTF